MATIDFIYTVKDGNLVAPLVRILYNKIDQFLVTEDTNNKPIEYSVLEYGYKNKKSFATLREVNRTSDCHFTTVPCGLCSDAALFFKGNELKDEHPGFPKEALVYHTITDTWTSAGAIPRNHVTTIAVEWDGAVIIPSGEVRPRVRSPKVWSVRLTRP